MIDLILRGVVDHDVFYKNSIASKISLAVWVDVIIITGNDHKEVMKLKHFFIKAILDQGFS